MCHKSSVDSKIHTTMAVNLSESIFFLFNLSLHHRFILENLKSSLSQTFRIIQKSRLVIGIVV